MSFSPVPGSRKAESHYLDISTESFPFKLSYPGTSKSKVPNIFSDPNYPDDQLIAGGLSGLWYDAGVNRYFTVSDVGPQAQDIPEERGFAFEGEKVFNDPDFKLQVYELQQSKKGKVKVSGEVTLNVPDEQGGFRPATGIGQMYRINETTGEVSGLDSAAFTPDGMGGYTPVPADAFGMDPEAVLRLSIDGLNDGKAVFAVSDEYRPQVSIHDAETGNLIHRIVPKGSSYKGYGYEEGRGEVKEFTKKTLPKVYLERRGSRGFEALAYNSNNGLLYAFIQTPMDVNGERKGSTVRRIIAMDPITGEAKHEYIYRQSGPIKQDKIGDAVYDAERNVFYVIDRDNVADETANKAVIEMDLTRATDVLGFKWESILGEGVYAPEMLDTPEEVGEALRSPLMNGIISEVHQTTLFNLAEQGINTLFDKPEGLALKPDVTLVFGFDNDFQRVDGRPDNMLAVVTDRFGDLKASSAEFVLNYPGTNSPELPASLEDPNQPDVQIIAGGLSGLTYDADLKRYFTISDVGPQVIDIPEGQGFAFEGEKIFSDPDFKLQVTELSYKIKPGKAKVKDTTTLRVPDGEGGFRDATGIAQMYSINEETGEIGGLDSSNAAFTTDGNGGYVPVAPDAFGLDPESIQRISIDGLNDGNPIFAVSDEYRPQVALFDAESGELIHRIVPEGSDYNAISYEPGRGDVPEFTKATLPEVYLERRGSRGFEALAYNSDDGLLYAFIQTPMSVGGDRSSSTVRRILAMDPVTGQPQHEYMFSQIGPSNQDKIGDAVYDPERGAFLVIDRDNGDTVAANKSILRMDLSEATDTLGYDWESLLGDGVYAPELLESPAAVAEAFAEGDVMEVDQVELLNLPSLPGVDPRFDKPEGLALKPDGTLVVGFDNDFARVDGRPDNLLTAISL
ncbi:atypical alkaline phosphatase with phytase-like insertion domain protein [Synechococcus sp. BOUM118]|nr:atypical alkaline phosphatase with phytase-like insertion domain protein [Synechococcus sp. BOUM118]